MLHHPVFVRDMPNSNGAHVHGDSLGQFRKNLWGGKSSGHDYIMALITFLQKHGFKPTDGDPCLLATTGKIGPTLVAVTVDELLVIAPAEGDIDGFNKILTSKYQVKRLGKRQEFLGWSVTYESDDGIMISHPTLAQTTLANAIMKDCNPRQTPYKNDEEVCPPQLGDTLTPQHQEKFRQLVGDLNYSADSTRTDLGYITGKLGAALTKPTARHLEALKAVMRYLKETTHVGIKFAGGQQRPPEARLLQRFTDASYAADTTDRKSTSGMVITYNGG